LSAAAFIRTYQDGTTRTCWQGRPL
jgi:hypothetical protein